MERFEIHASVETVVWPPGHRFFEKENVKSKGSMDKILVVEFVESDGKLVDNFVDPVVLGESSGLRSLTFGVIEIVWDAIYSDC